MHVIKPRIKALFLQGIDGLQKQGITPTAEEIVWLYTLAEKAIKPDAGNNIAFFDAPIKVCGINLYPLTIQASIWIEQYARKWWSNKPRKDLWAVVYAMAKGKDKETLLYMTERRSAWRKIRRFMFRHFFISEKKLRDAVVQIIGDYDYVQINQKESKIDPPSWGEVITTLCGLYHLPPEIFLCDYSTATVIDMLRNAPRTEGRPQSENIQAFLEYKDTIKFIAAQHKIPDKDSVIKDSDNE